jgi:hypothetical protein
MTTNPSPDLVADSTSRSLRFHDTKAFVAANSLTLPTSGMSYVVKHPFAIQHTTQALLLCGLGGRGDGEGERVFSGVVDPPIPSGSLHDTIIEQKQAILFFERELVLLREAETRVKEKVGGCF